MSVAKFARGDLIESEKHGGLGLVLGTVQENPTHVKIDWVVLPDRNQQWIYREWHAEFDYQTGGYGLRKIGEIKL